MGNSRLIQRDNLLESVSEVSNILKKRRPDMDVNITLLEEVEALLTKGNLTSGDLERIDKTIGYLCHFKCLYDFCPLELLEGETEQARWQRWGQIIDQMENRSHLLCSSIKSKHK